MEQPKTPDQFDQDASPKTKKGRKRKQQPASLDTLSTDLIRNTPPQSLEAEQAVLGGVFLDSTSFHLLPEILEPDDFYYPAHQAIYASFLGLFSSGSPVDLVTVGEQLLHDGKLEQVGGGAYLLELTQSVVSASNIVYHAKIIRDKALQRKLITASTEIIQDCFDNTIELGALLDESEKRIFSISERCMSGSYKDSHQLVNEIFQNLEKLYERKELVTGVHTGYQKLNELTAGFQPSDLIIIAGRPSMGKTAFALNVAMRAAVTADVPTAIFSLEMSMESLMTRMLCAWGKVDLSRVRRGFLDDEDWIRLHEAADHLRSAPVFIDDTPALSTLEIRARCRRLKAEKQLGLVVVDYLQLMRAGRRIDSREQEISEISRNLKALAKELDVPVIALSQLNRKLEERADKRPMLSDLRESGAIEQDADVIMFVYRDQVYNKSDDNPKKGMAEIIIGKQRNGPLGNVELSFVDYCTAFEELAAAYPSESSY